MEKKKPEAIIFKIRGLLKARIMTQTSLAHTAGMSLSSLSQVLNGHVPASSKNIPKIAKGFGLSVEELCRGTELEGLEFALKSETREDQIYGLLVPLLIKKQRNEGISQNELSRRGGMATGQLNNIIEGRGRHLAPTTIARCIACLGFTVQGLLNTSGKAKLFTKLEISQMEAAHATVLYEVTRDSLEDYRRQLERTEVALEKEKAAHLETKESLRKARSKNRKIAKRLVKIADEARAILEDSDDEEGR